MKNSMDTILNRTWLSVVRYYPVQRRARSSIILVTTLSSRGCALTSSENRTNHSCFTTLPSTNFTARRFYSASSEILHAPEKDILVSKNANVFEESALLSEHNGENSIFLARLIPLLR